MVRLRLILAGIRSTFRVFLLISALSRIQDFRSQKSAYITLRAGRFSLSRRAESTVGYALTRQSSVPIFYTLSKKYDRRCQRSTSHLTRLLEISIPINFAQQRVARAYKGAEGTVKLLKLPGNHLRL